MICRLNVDYWMHIMCSDGCQQKSMNNSLLLHVCSAFMSNPHMVKGQISHYLPVGMDKKQHLASVQPQVEVDRGVCTYTYHITSTYYIVFM